MQKNIETWRSPSLGRDMTLAVYGRSGTPVLALPTRGAKHGQWEQQGMVEAIAHQLGEEYNQLFCIDAVDEESFLNETVTADRRVTRQTQFEAYVVEEVVPYIRQHNDIPYLIIAGSDLGGYHAVNLALKHPEEFGKVIGMSGVYDIKTFLGDHYDDDVYYNNPVDYVPNLGSSTLLQHIQEVDFRLATFSGDSRESLSRRMSHVLRMKFVEHELDVWNLPGEKEWELWKRMLRTHII
ncbi:MAG: alpha/beta fold hydrolase [Balneolaceae bacterium]|nr:alpha/beta fold hydrolase [Balneolaceae bacterium]